MTMLATVSTVAMQLASYQGFGGLKENMQTYFIQPSLARVWYRGHPKVTGSKQVTLL